MAVNGINKSDLQKLLKWLKYSKFRGSRPAMEQYFVRFFHLNSRTIGAIIDNGHITEDTLEKAAYCIKIACMSASNGNFRGVCEVAGVSPANCASLEAVERNHNVPVRRW